MRESFGLFATEHEFVGWLQMLSPVPICERSGFKQISNFSACCQLHAVQDCLKHAGEDYMSVADRVTCIKAVEYLRAGRGVRANGPVTLPPNYSIESETEH